MTPETKEKLKGESMDKVTLNNMFAVNYDRIITVDLSGLGMYALPDEIGQLQELEMLKLSGNKFSSLPQSIGNLKSLKRLCVDYNALTSLPEEIGEMKELEYLDISNNLITQLPESIATLPNLKYINVANNKINNIPSALDLLMREGQLVIEGYIAPEEYATSVKAVWSTYNRIKWYCFALISIAAIIATFKVTDGREMMALFAVQTVLYLNRPKPKYHVDAIHLQSGATGFCDEFEDESQNIHVAVKRAKESEIYQQWLKTRG